MTLTEKIQRMLFELNDTYQQYGSEYMSHPYEQEQHTTLQPELPIMASSAADMQLTETQPPVDDENYVPSNRKELGSALTALAARVEDSEVSTLYARLKDLMASDLTELESPVDDGVNENKKDSIAHLRGLVEAYWGDVKTGSPRDDLSDLGVEEEIEDDELDDDGNYIGASPDTIPLKYLAQYYRDKPGVDKSKLKGTGETTVVTATGRTLQQVIRPLFGVPKDDLEDATDYLRLQFKIIAEKQLGMEKVPAEAPKTFQGMYFKRLVPKLDKSQLGANFLMTVINDYKRRNKRWLKDLAEKALAEVASERAAYAELKSTLEKEAPELANLW